MVIFHSYVSLPEGTLQQTNIATDLSHLYMIYHLSFKKVIFHSELLVYQRVDPPVIKPHQKLAFDVQMPGFCLRRFTLWSLD